MIINSKSQLQKIVKQEKSQGKKVLVKKGVFDIIHPGHVFAIKSFAKEADTVIIFIQTDALTTIKKGPARPINPQLQRATVIDGLKHVDYVYLDKSESRKEYLKVLREVKPSIVAITTTNLQKANAYSSPHWELIQFPDKKIEGYSTTEIIKKVNKKQFV